MLPHPLNRRLRLTASPRFVERVHPGGGGSLELGACSLPRHGPTFPLPPLHAGKPLHLHTLRQKTWLFSFVFIHLARKTSISLGFSAI